MMNENYTTPTATDDRQDLIYKTVGDTKLDMIFLPPTEKRYDRAPVYFVIPGGGWHTTSAQSMVGFSARSIATLRARGWAVASISYRLTPHAVIDEIISDCMDGGRYLAAPREPTRLYHAALRADPHHVRYARYARLSRQQREGLRSLSRAWRQVRDHLLASGRSLLRANG